MTNTKTVAAQTLNVQAVLAMNPRFKIKEGEDKGKVEGRYHRGYAEPATAEEIMDRLTAKDVKEDVRLIREEGRADLKDTGMFTLTPHYSQFKDNHRCQACIMPEAFTFKTCIDVDKTDFVDAAIQGALEVNMDPLSEWQDQVLFIEYSPRKKVHIWLLLPQGKTIEETQRQFCADINIPFDESCITPERYINMTGDIVYMSPRWLEPLSPEDIEERREAFLLRGLDVDGRKLVACAGERSNAAPASPSHVAALATPANARTRFIMGECLKQAGLQVKHLNIQGSDDNDRGGIHTAVKCLLSVGVPQLLSEGEALGVLQELMPQYWQVKKILLLVHDFFTKYHDDSQRMTLFQRRVFAASQKIDPAGVAQPQKAEPEKGEDDAKPVYGDTAPLSEIYDSPLPPILSKSGFPRFVKAATLPVPAEAKETAAQAMFPPLGMYCDASFEYIDNTPREPRLNCLVIAGTGTGKDSSTKHMLEHLEAPRQEEDGPNRKILADWKAECKRLEGKNEDKPPRPNVSVRSVAANITPARLSELMSDSQGRIIHTRMIEFDQFFGIEGWKPGTNCPFTNLKLTDDEGNPFGQERVGKDSITYRGPLSINWNASTTVSKAQYYFRNVMTDGPISRLCLATVPDRGLGAAMPRHGRYDEKYDASLSPFIDNLREAQGLIVCKQAKRMAENLKVELDNYVIQAGSTILDNLGHRALVHVFRKACLLYVANGMKWEKQIEAFCRWSLHYDLYLKLHFFGELILSADGEVKTARVGARNLLQQLPKNFSRLNLVEVRLANAMKEEGTDSQLRQWVHRGFITKTADGMYERVTA